MPNVFLVVLNLFAANLSVGSGNMDAILINKATGSNPYENIRITRTIVERRVRSSDRLNQAELTTQFEDQLKKAVETQNSVLDLQVHNYYTIAESA